MADIKALKQFRQEHQCSLWVARQCVEHGVPLDEALAAEAQRQQESAALAAANAAATRERRIEEAQRYIERERLWARLILANLERGKLTVTRCRRKTRVYEYDSGWGREFAVPDWEPVVVVRYNMLGDEWVNPDRGQTDREVLEAFEKWVRQEEKRRIDDIRRSYRDVLP